MPKDIFYPVTSEVTVENLKETDVLKIPKRFNSDLSLNLPVTIKPGEEITFDGPTFNKKPYDVMLEYEYFFDTTSTPEGTVQNERIGSVYTVPSVSKKPFLKDNIKDTTRVLFRLSFEEKYGAQRAYGATINEGEAHMGKDNNSSTATHLYHVNAVNSDLVFENFYVDNSNTLKLTYKNRGTTDIVLNKPITMEAIVPPDHSRIEYNQIVKVFGNKFLVCSSMFCRNTDSTGPTIDVNNEIVVHTLNNGVITSSESISNVNTFKCITNGSEGLLGLSNVITWTQPNTQSYMNFGSMAACVNSSNADEYFVAFTTYNNKVIMYDSSQGGWENKTGGNITEQPSGLSAADCAFTFPHTNELYTDLGNISRARKPMAIKHFLSTGNVHALVAGFKKYDYLPRVFLSTDNLKTFTTIFDESNLPQFNITPEPLIKEAINPAVDTKIINENTFYVQTCVFGKYKTDEDEYTFPLNMFLKTTDQGTTWIDIMEDHPEYRTASSHTSYISEDGKDIYVVAFYARPENVEYKQSVLFLTQQQIGTIYTQGGNKGGSTNVPPYIYPTGDNITKYILFNYSNDGGSTWKYPSGNWPNILTGSRAPYFSLHVVGFQANHNGVLGNNTSFVYHDKKTNNIIVGIPGTNINYGYIYVSSYDNGLTWNKCVPEDYADITYNIETDNYNMGYRNANIELPISPSDYNDDHLILIGSMEGRDDKGDQNNMYTAHELSYLKTLGRTVDINKIPRSCIFMTKSLDNIVIDHVEGYHT